MLDSRQDPVPPDGASRRAALAWLGTLVVLAVVCALLDARRRSSERALPRSAAPTHAAGEPEPSRLVSQGGAEILAPALERLAGQSPGARLHVQPQDSSSFVFVERASAASLRVRVSAYVLNPESHARLATLWREYGTETEPYRPPIGEVVFYDLALPLDPELAGLVVERVLLEVFELAPGYDLFLEETGPDPEGH